MLPQEMFAPRRTSASSPVRELNDAGVEYLLVGAHVAELRDFPDGPTHYHLRQVFDAPTPRNQKLDMIG